MKNGGLYLKFGQVISSLDIVIPDSFKKTFESMCIDCPQSPYEDVVQ